MRCKNCGWSNEPDAKKCVKCNAPLSGSMINSEQIFESNLNKGNESASLRKTHREPFSGKDISGLGDNYKLCPRCGYNVAPDMISCPVCNTLIPDTGLSSPDSNDVNGISQRQSTINPWSCGINPNGTSYCQLQPIAWEGENISYQPQSYSGEKIVLNRSNTDPNNHSITSQQQAVLSFENGKWYIENKSAHKSTFIQVNNKMPLNDGDIILMGNRMFVFHKH